MVWQFTMKSDSAYNWLVQSEKRKTILGGFNQPLTASQVARRTGINLDSSLHLLWGLRLHGVIHCLNKDTSHNRLYWLTALGKACQERLRNGLKPITHRFPKIPWDVYSSICYSHRSATIRAMHKPMQAVERKKEARRKDSTLRMSANNVRDVTNDLLKKGIVQRLEVKRKRHPRYELTDLGRTFQELLVRATVSWRGTFL